MSPPSQLAPSFSNPTDLLESFVFERILSQDPLSQTASLLGTAVPTNSLEAARVPAILRIARTQKPLESEDLIALSKRNAWGRLELVTNNDMYSTILGWELPKVEGPKGVEYQLSSICPASEKQIKKYTAQESRMVRETPELYETVVKPYIESQPLNQVEWVYRILDGTAEAESVIYRDDDPASGFIMAPDLKWDKKTLSTLYLLVISQIKTIRSLRDLRAVHLPLLKKIRVEAERAAIEVFAQSGLGLKKGMLRMFVHYQPTYYHFHVHIVHISHVSFHGISVGQAHLLDDIIDNIELDSEYYAKRTLCYGLGVEHGLFKGLAGSV